MKWTDQKRRVNKQSGCNRDEEILEVITLLCAAVPLVEITANQNEAPGGVWRLNGALAKRQRFKYLGSFRTPGKGLMRLNIEMIKHVWLWLIWLKGLTRFQFSSLSLQISTSTHLLFSKAFTVVSLANELTKFAISTRMHGRRK